MKNTTALKAACIGLLASPLLMMSEPANAGWNGQQLAVNTTAARRIKIEGHNQNNNFATWESTSSSGATTFRTNGWWWKGNVKITVTFSSGHQGVCNVNVPVRQSSDWVNTQCGFIPRLF
jgi:hypothetical protein